MGQVAEQGEGRRSRSAERVGVIAGAGALPAAALSSLVRAGRRAIAFGFTGVEGPCPVEPENRLPLGALARLRERLRACDVEHVLVVGHFAPAWLPEAEDPTAHPSAPPVEPDAEALALLATLPRRDGAALMPAIAAWLGAQGFVLLAQDEALPSLLATLGAMGRVDPPAEAAGRVDVALAALAACEAGSARALAQSVAIRGERVVAVEGVEGTDALIRTAGEGAFVVKAARAGQDRRLDLPAVGPDTLVTMAEVGATALALEAGSVLVVDREEVVRRADEAGIAVFGFAGRDA